MNLSAAFICLGLTIEIVGALRCVDHFVGRCADAIFSRIQELHSIRRRVFYWHVGGEPICECVVASDCVPIRRKHNTNDAVDSLNNFTCYRNYHNTWRGFGWKK
jgi:hypothetical protein